MLLEFLIILCFEEYYFLFKGNQESEEYEEVPLVDALNGYLPPDGGSGENFRFKSTLACLLIAY